MQVDYKKVESSVMPLEIDVISSPGGIYIRRNIEKITTKDENENEIVKYRYQEAFLTKSEYEQYSKDLLVGQINDEDNTAEYEAYKKKLDTGVLYKNGRYYKPKWTSIYFKKALEIKTMLELRQAMKNLQTETADGSTLPDISSLTINVYDVTALPENAVAMTPLEVADLWLFLTLKQEEFFNEYKQSLNIQ